MDDAWRGRRNFNFQPSGAESRRSNSARQQSCCNNQHRNLHVNSTSGFNSADGPSPSYILNGGRPGQVPALQSALFNHDAQ